METLLKWMGFSLPNLEFEALDTAHQRDRTLTCCLSGLMTELDGKTSGECMFLNPDDAARFFQTIRDQG